MKRTQSKTRIKSEDTSSSQKRKKKVFISFVPQDGELAEELKDMIEKTQAFQVIPFDQSQDWHNEGMWDMPLLHRLISEADAVVAIYTQNAVKEEHASWLRYEYGFAVFRANIYYNQSDSFDYNPCSLVRVVMDDHIDTISGSPPDLRAFKAIDYRDLHSHEYSLDKLVSAMHGKDHQPTIYQRQRYVFNEAMAPNPRREMLRRVLQDEFDYCFRKHIGPLQERLQHLADLQRAQDNLMTPEIISIEEANAYDEIWVVSHSLHNDLHDEKIRNSIIKNIDEGIRYIYFLPNTPLIKRRKEQFETIYNTHCNIDKSQITSKGKNKSGNFQFITLDAGVFMPFDELVVYDGESATNRWGYIQMNYDRPSSGNTNTGLVMKVPDRTLNTIIEFLIKMKSLTREE